jgi:hypothetical protein
MGGCFTSGNIAKGSHAWRGATLQNCDHHHRHSRFDEGRVNKSGTELALSP